MVVAGRPSTGKTTFALKAAMRVVLDKKLPVFIFSIEQTKEKLIARILEEREQFPIKG